MDGRKRKRDESPQRSDFKPTSSEFSGYSRSTDPRRPHRARQPNSFQNRNFEPRRNYPTPFRSLEKLYRLNRKNSNEILMELIANQESFSEYLESNLESDQIVLTLAILSKVCSSSCTENKIVIMNMVTKPSFTETLVNYVANLPNESMKTRKIKNYFWNRLDDFFVNLAAVSECLIETVPTKACEVLPKLLKVVDGNIAILVEQPGIEVSETTKSKMKTLIEKLDLCKKELERKEQEHESRVLPPEDFRTLSVYPTTEEILSPNPGFIRKNIIEGRYSDVEHYLDVQFRLLKEDFVGPLRQGLAEYFKQPQGSQSMEFSNMEVHSDVVFRSPIFEKDRVGVIVNFSNQDASDRIFSPSFTDLNYGSLVCFTKNNFGSVLFGKVIDRDCDERQLIISFGMEHIDFELNIPYLMVECKVYFEPYYHVLKALQCMSELNFPMKRYLIDVDSSVEPPGYLDEGSPVFTIGDQKVDLFGNAWPSADNLRLNSSQYSAFKAALTQKFVVIQGPPGTGKTYLGLEIIKTLLQEDNRRFWYNKTPILVVCFTNHALDQFLLGLTSTTEKIVRVGGRSKCEELDNFNLTNIRMNGNINNSKVRRTYRTEVGFLTSELQKYTEQLKLIKKYKYIINFRHFDCIDEELTNSWFLNATNSEICNWLFADRSNASIKFNSNVIQSSETVEDINGEESDQFNNLNELQNDNICDDSFDVTSKHNLRVLVSKHEMCVQIADLQKKLQKMESHTQKQTDAVKKLELETQLNDLQETFQYFNMRMRAGEVSPAPVKPPNVNYHAPHRMHPNDRWNLYFYWMNLYRERIVAKLVELQGEYEKAHKKYNEVKSIIDTEIMKNNLVVGMTTTCAARLHTTLQVLKSPIVIVEEAAEVLESHVTVSLTSHCKHLILVGDHQQLRPITADHRIEQKFNLGISMFERMVRNNIQCHTLTVQHRMRPEIANLIVPHIYPKLENHHSVTSYPPISGMGSPLYFIHHDHEESKVFNTKSNLHEAKFLTNLACYLIHSGYKSKDITILVAYSGQFLVLRDEVRKQDNLLEGIRICVLDNFQGEECKIILLSLVRNSRKGNIGFLKNANRICVALSRAREGFYIMGNINLLCQYSEIWRKVKDVLVKQNSLGGYLSVHCVNHPHLVTKIKEPEDFKQVGPGYCKRKCEDLLKCGHRCSRLCHTWDRNHKMHRCEEKCLRVICKYGHVCRNPCYQICSYCSFPVIRQMDCGHVSVLPCSVEPRLIRCQVPVKAALACGHELDVPCNVELKSIKCQIPVTAILPCGHRVKKPCFEDENTFKCTLECFTQIEPCGHTCTYTCHINMDPNHIGQRRCRKPCERIALECSTNEHRCVRQCSDVCFPCNVIVKKKFPKCRHIRDEFCSTNMKNAFCMEPCKKRLPCGHECEKHCYEACGGCYRQVEKIAECGHEMTTECSNTLEGRLCFADCLKKLECGHRCKKRCDEICSDICLELVKLKSKAACGHKFKVECHIFAKRLPHDDARVLQFCKEPCSTVLECTHKCTGTCGECFQGRLHSVCSKRCLLTQTCGHRCKSLCGDVCRPCSSGCLSKCSHAKCYLRCAKNCAKCNKPCARVCKHQKCTAKCWDKCTVGPCQEPCDKLLPCAHPCVGFCGDPCPPICRICNGKVLTERFLGLENEEDSRFVLLEECKHVIESRGLERYFNERNTENGVLVECKQCPRCKTPLAFTHRYRKYIQRVKSDIVNVQRKAHGDFFEREAKRKSLRLALDNFKTKISVEKSEAKLSVLKTLEVIQACSTFLTEEKRSFNLFIGKIIETMIGIFECIYKMNFEKLTFNERLKIETYWNHVFRVRFLPIKDIRFTNQVIFDLESEICRLERIIQLFDIAAYSTDLSEINEFIFRPIPYTKDFDDQMTAKLEGLFLKLDMKLPEIKYGEILTDLRLKKHQWFYCHDGHYYKDFGEPNQVAKCDQCWE